MSEDFDKESKKKQMDAKKFVKLTKKQQQEKQIAKAKSERDMKLELKRKGKFMANIVQLYWKNCEKIVKHNYGV